MYKSSDFNVEHLILKEELDQERREKSKEEAWRHYHQLEDSIYKNGPKANFKRDQLLQHISFKSAKLFNYMNPFSTLSWFDRLNQGLIQTVGVPDPCWMITAIHLPFMTDDVDWEINIQAHKQKLWDALRPFNFIGMIEFAYFLNVLHGKGLLVAPHYQGIMWGEPSRSDFDRMHDAFDGGPTGACGLFCQDVYDLEGALHYGVKLPSYGQKLVPIKNENKFWSCSSRLYLPKHYALFQNLKDYSFSGLTVAGGQGRDVRLAAINPPAGNAHETHPNPECLA